MGFWISPEGKTYRNEDHYLFIIAHPRLFGMKKKDLKGTLDDRQPTIDLALSNNWIRVRGTRPNLSAEFAVLDNRTIFNLKSFFQEYGVDPDEKVLFEEVATGASWYKPASWVIEDEALSVARNPRKRRRLALRR